MARSGNRDVARALAEELGLHFAFAPCYLNLAKGSGREYDVRGENDIGLHGNAILSRYPLECARVIPLENGKDKMAGREKRLVSQAALAVEVLFPGLPLTAVAVHSTLTPTGCVQPTGRRTPPSPAAEGRTAEATPRLTLSKLWRELIYRIFEVDPLTCPRCGAEMKILAFIIDPKLIRQTLDHPQNRPRPRAPPQPSRAH